MASYETLLDLQQDARELYLKHNILPQRTEHGYVRDARPLNMTLDFDAGSIRDILDNLNDTFQIPNKRMIFLETTAIALLEKDGVGNAKEVFYDLRDTVAREQYGATAATVAVSDSIIGQRNRLPKIQYDTLIRLACQVRPVGNWYLMFADLAGDLRSETLLCKSVPRVVASHPTSVIGKLDGAHASIFINAIDAARNDLKAAYESAASRVVDPVTGKLDPIIKALKWAWDNLDKLSIAYTIAKELWDEHERRREAEEARRRAEEAQRKLDREISLSAPLRGAEHHVDSFEKNRDWISRTA
ncbi:hypothetical protein [Azospirillum sp. Marseille-Q6669]